MKNIFVYFTLAWNNGYNLWKITSLLCSFLGKGQDITTGFFRTFASGRKCKTSSIACLSMYIVCMIICVMCNALRFTLSARCKGSEKPCSRKGTHDYRRKGTWTTAGPKKVTRHWFTPQGKITAANGQFPTISLKWPIKFLKNWKNGWPFQISCFPLYPNIGDVLRMLSSKVYPCLWRHFLQGFSVCYSILGTYIPHEVRDHTVGRQTEWVITRHNPIAFTFFPRIWS